MTAIVKASRLFTAYFLPNRAGLRIALTARWKGVAMNIGGIFYLLVMAGIVGGPWFVMTIFAKTSRRQRSRQVQQRTANFLR
jgi:hypothetical protein